jgi:alpha-glucosidase
MLALPGSAYLYQGEELGLPEHTTLPDEVRQDPTWSRSDGEVAGRDGCRVPLPWTASAPGFGFGPTGRTWLPQPPSFGAYAADLQESDPSSTLEMYRSALRLRRELGLGSGALTWAPADADVLAFEVAGPAGRVRVVANLGAAPVPLPDGARVLLTSGPLDGDGRLPTDVAVWLELPAA